MTARPTRRQFLRAAAASGATAAFVAAFGSSPAYAADPRRSVPARVSASLSQAPAGALPASLPLGKPLADIAKGWDGTLTAIDTDGVPHHFDPIAGRWNVLGRGFDVVARWDNSRFLVTRGSEIVIGAADPVAMTSVWSNLPDSFAQRLDGAVNIRGTIHLFRNGRFLTIDPTTKRASAPVAVTAIAGWPTTNDAWRNGAVNVVGSNGSTIDDDNVLLWCNGEYVRVDMTARRVAEGPHPLNYYVGGQMLAAMQQGFTSLLWNETDYQVTAFSGPVAWESSHRDGTAAPFYTWEYHAAWAPLLQHAPGGRAGGRWASHPPAGALKNYPAYFDGSDWQLGPALDNGSFASVAVGSNGVVFGLTKTALCRLDPTSSTWASVAPAPTGAVQLAVGDTNHVWIRDSQNNVHRYNNNGGYTQVNLGHNAVHIAAGSDGTLWHAAGDTSIYRYLPEGTETSRSLSPGAPAGTIIDRVGATGFGSAFVLSAAAGTVYSYDTPFVFKTAASYLTGFNYSQANHTVTPAGHTVFVSNLTPSQQNAPSSVAALDAQTGVEVWRIDLPPVRRGSVVTSSTHVLDQTRDLLYVVAGFYIYALDAANGRLRWQFAADSEEFGKGSFTLPALAGGLLIVGHDSGHLLAFDTAAALAGNSQPLWAVQTQPNPGFGVYMGAPGFDTSTGSIYVATQLPLSGTINVVALDSVTGDTRWTQGVDSPAWNGPEPVPTETFTGLTRAADGATVDAVFVNAVNVVVAMDPATGNRISRYTLPAGTSGAPIGITSGISYRNDQLVFGDAQGTIYIVDALTLKLIRSVPATSKSRYGVISKPQLIAGANAADGVVVAFTRGDRNLYFYDPATGAVDELATDQTAPAVLVYDNTHGVLYATGWNDGNGTTQIGQLFAIRPDSYIQDERSFIVESELMQDYADDSEASGQGVSRYQTHVTVVDDTKAPRANQSVKLWADEPDTVVRIDNTTRTIGPDAPATFTTDATGSFTIVSDAGDLAAVTLRLWAPFMDEHERIAIVPDAEFHRRLSGTTATGDVDPQHLDMNTATSYDGAPLFTANGQAQQAATAVTQLTSSVGMGGGVATLLRAGAGTHTADNRYIALPDLPGLAYTPVDVAATQDITAQAPTGFSLTTNGHTPLTPAEAADLFDTLDGAEPVLLGGFLSSLRSAWHEIKTAAGTVVQVVVSVAKDVLAGIQYVVNGVTKVVKAVVQDIKDAAAAIGSFFVQLGKDLLKVVQAVSKLLRLKQVFATAKIIRDLISGMFTNLGALLDQGKQDLDGWFETAETTLSNDFCALYENLGLAGCGNTGGPPVSSTEGMGATPTTVYNQGAEPGTSQAVESGWSTHTLRTNINQADTATTLDESAADPFAAMGTLVETFLDTLRTDPVLSATYTSLGRSFSGTFKATSPEQFLAGALQDILEIFRALAETALAIGRALVDALLSATETLVNGLQALGAVKIPVLSALWRALTGNDLTFIDLFAFVLAFPITFVYRAVEGTYPSDATALQGAAAESQSVTKRVLGLVGSIGMIVAGVITAFVDGLAIVSAGVFAPSVPIKIAGIALLISAASSSIYAAYSASQKFGKPEPWTTSLATTSVLGIVLAIAPAIIKPKAFGNGVFAILGMTLSMFNIAFLRLKAAALPDPALTLTRGILSTVPALVAPAKLDGYPVGLIVPASDLAFRWAAGGIQMAQTIQSWDSFGSTDEDPGAWMPAPSTPTDPGTTTPTDPGTTTPTDPGTTTPTTSPTETALPPLSTTAGSSVASTTASTPAATLKTTGTVSGNMAYTGVDIGAGLLGGIGALAVGGVAVVAARRRREQVAEYDMNLELERPAIVSEVSDESRKDKPQHPSG